MTDGVLGASVVVLVLLFPGDITAKGWANKREQG